MLDLSSIQLVLLQGLKPFICLIDWDTVPIPSKDPLGFKSSPKHSVSQKLLFVEPTFSTLKFCLVELASSAWSQTRVSPKHSSSSGSFILVGSGIVSLSGPSLSSDDAYTPLPRSFACPYILSGFSVVFLLPICLSSTWLCEMFSHLLM